MLQPLLLKGKFWLKIIKDMFETNIYIYIYIKLNDVNIKINIKSVFQRRNFS